MRTSEPAALPPATRLARASATPRALAVLLLAAAALALSAPSHATAQTCGGSDDDNGSWSSDADDDGSSSAGDASGASGVEVCRDTTDVTGFEECSRFGRGWDVAGVPALTLGIALGVRRVSLAGIRIEGTSMHEENPFHWAVGGEDLEDPTATAVAFDLRGTLFLTRFTYVGAEVGLGGASLAGPAIATGDVSLTPRSAFVLTVGGLAGASIPLGSFALRGELFAGLRAVSVTFESRLAACVSSTQAWSADPSLEPRVSLDWFISPWLTVGVFGGADVVNEHAFHGGLTLVLHPRSYDGS